MDGREAFSRAVSSTKAIIADITPEQLGSAVADRVHDARMAITTDVLVHGWDLARATEHALPADDELAEHMLGFVRAGITEKNRSPMFAAAAAPPHASPMDKLAAFLGRDPSAVRARR